MRGYRASSFGEAPARVLARPLGALMAALVALSCATVAAHAAPEAGRPTASVAGEVRDASGGLLPGVTVELLTADRDSWGTAVTDAAGRYEIRDVPPGRYLLAARARGFAATRRAVVLEAGRGLELTLTLGTPTLEEEVTVTAERGSVRSVEDAPQPVTVIGADDIASRAKAVVAQVANGETAVHLQRTSPTIAGIYVRGLTGKNVNVFVDGVRYSTSAQRGGISTFLDLIEPTALESVEVLRGPQSAQYGSDALGGSIQFLTRSPSFSADRPRWSGGLATSFDSANAGYGGSLGTAYAARGFGLTADLAGRRASTQRVAGGVDSRNAVTRFLGLASDVVLDERLPDTAFTQYGGLLKASWAPAPGSQLRLSYQRSQQDGGRRYDQLLGGDGNLVADLRNLMLDNAQLKYDRLRLGWLDELSVSYSFNAQREERVNQGGNGNPRATLTHEYEKTRVHGGQTLLSKTLGAHALQLGGDFYAEAITAPSFGENPTTGATAVRRGRVPDGATYRSGGAYLQDALEAAGGKLQLVGAVRLSHAAYAASAADSPLVNGQPLWPDDSYSVSSFTFRVGAAFRPAPPWSLTASVARGFRAPHVTDLGTYGLTGSGYEVAAPDVAGLGATLGNTADRNAVSTGIPVTQVTPEKSLSYDTGLTYRTSRVKVRLGVFLNDVDDNLTKQTLILPPGSVGVQLGDQMVTSQTAGGAVFVPASSNPVLVRANYDDARIWGVEGELEARPAGPWSFSAALTYLHAADKRSGLPPNIEGGTPAPDAWLRVRYSPGKGRFWVEPYLHAALEQDRLSTLDLEDRRTGATRSRSSIASFFANGATVRGLVAAGPDGRLGSADDRLIATGETLAQVQTRVLGTASSAPLYTSLPAYSVVGVRAGLRFAARHELLIDVDNVTDENYRGVSWGIDAPGRGVYLRYSTRF
jgi:hemoglobin/transferrin/lactoferrin receptor protein